MKIEEKMFYEALRIRRVEEKIVEIYPSDKIQSPVHLSIGQEHHIVALCHALQKADQVYTTYRSHAVYLAKGGCLKQMLAELYGKNSAMAKGKAGSMHLCAPEVGLMGSSAIVGAVFSHALGAAYAVKFKNKDQLVVSITGEGATEEGTFHESINFASLKKLPLLFVIENNGLAIHTPLHKRQSFNLQKLAAAYDVEYLYADDGLDMKAVFEKAGRLREKILGRQRPAVLEIRTYRYKAHVGVHDDFASGYRDKKDFEQWSGRYPLVLRTDLIEKFGPGISEEIEAAVNFAQASNFPPAEEVLKDVC